MTRNRAISKERYENRKRDLAIYGICVFCGRMVEPERVLCPKCQAKAYVNYWTKRALEKHPELKHE